MADYDDYAFEDQSAMVDLDWSPDELATPAEIFAEPGAITACPECGSTDIFIDFISSDRVCTRCGLCCYFPLIVAPAFQVWREGHSSVEPNSQYRHKFYAAELISQVTGYGPRIPRGILKVVSRRYKQLGYANWCKGRRLAVRRAASRRKYLHQVLKSLKKDGYLFFNAHGNLTNNWSKWAEKWIQFTQEFARRFIPPTIDSDEYAIFMRRFEHVSNTWCLIRSTVDRNSIPCMPYIIIKLFEFMNRAEVSEYLHVVETPSKLRETEMYWEMICDRNGWLFISHRPVSLYRRLISLPNWSVFRDTFNSLIKPGQQPILY